MRSEAEAYRAIDRYADLVRRICFVRMKNHADVEDIFQDVFLKYLLHDQGFQSEAHEKAWFIRVTINACKDSLKSFFRKKVSSLEDIPPVMAPLGEEKTEVWDAILRLPQKYRDVIYLFYYEGYTAVEIAKILEKNENTIYTWLRRAKTQLKEQMGGDDGNGSANF